MSKKDDKTYARAVASHRHLQRTTKKAFERNGKKPLSDSPLAPGGDAYGKANKAALDSYQKLSLAQKALFNADPRTTGYKP